MLTNHVITRLDTQHPRNEVAVCMENENGLQANSDNRLTLKVRNEEINDEQKVKKKKERCKDSTKERVEEVGRDGKDQDKWTINLTPAQRQSMKMHTKRD